MIFAAQDVGNTHIEIVHRTRQHVKPASVCAPHDWIGQLGGIEFLWPSHPIAPGDLLVMIEHETPMRHDTLRLLGRTVFLAQFKGPAIIYRRQATSEPDLALQLEFLLRFVAGINAAGRLQRNEGFFVFRQTL